MDGGGVVTVVEAGLDVVVAVDVVAQENPAKVSWGIVEGGREEGSLHGLATQGSDGMILTVFVQQSSRMTLFF
jgi:hypothetical protein